MAEAETSPRVEISTKQTAEQLKLLQLANAMGLSFEELSYLDELSPYLILDGHRTGIDDHEENPARGYLEGAVFSMRFARILQEMGGRRATFLIHTLRNWNTLDRMAAIFDGIGRIAKKFILTAVESDIKLKYYGYGVHNVYALSSIINKAEQATSSCNSFDLNFLTNYSEEWGSENPEELSSLPEISVIGRFTKGHYSGAGIPGHASKANFVYIQQGSVSENWSDDEIIVLILSLLKSHLALKGFVGGKSYEGDERTEIRRKRELELFSDDFALSSNPKKRIISFTPTGPITITF